MFIPELPYLSRKRYCDLAVFIFITQDEFKLLEKEIIFLSLKQQSSAYFCIYIDKLQM
jgi:hypothetical protein